MRPAGKRWRWVGVLCLALAGMLAVGLAWPSPRARIDLTLSPAQAQPGWASLGPSVQEMAVAIQLPASVLEGRRERVELAVNVAPDGAALPAYTLAAEIISTGAAIAPPGETGQSLRPVTSFAWTLVADSGPTASATILVRLRRHALGGEAEAERLLVARDVQLPVRSLAGLSAPAATWAAAILGLVGAGIWFAVGVWRRR